MPHFPWSNVTLYKNAAEGWLSVGPGEGALHRPPGVQSNGEPLMHLRGPRSNAIKREVFRDPSLQAWVWVYPRLNFPAGNRLIVKSLWS